MSNTWTWIGGGNNEWNNPADWQPHGVPRPGDTLLMNGGTLNMQGMVGNLWLTGDYYGTVNTVNLTESALNLQVGPRGTDNINLLSGDAVNIQMGLSNYSGYQSGFIANLTLGDGNIVNLTQVSGYPSFGLTVQVNGNGDVLHSNNVESVSPSDISIAPGKSLLLTGDLSGWGFRIDGGTLINDGTITMIAATGEISSAVLGHGTIYFAGYHDETFTTISGPTGAGQTFSFARDGVGDVATIEHPDTFHSTVDFAGPVSLFKEFILAGLSASSYDIKNDFLTLYQGNNPVYHLRVTNIPEDFYVASSGGSVTIGTPFYNYLPAPGTALPVHTTGIG